MLIRDPDQPVSQASVPSLWRTLERVQVSLGVDNALFAELMRLTENEWLRLKGSGREPVVRSVMALAQELRVSFEALMEDRVDYSTMALQFHGHEGCLPERYLCGAFGRMRIAQDYLDRVEKHLGWRKRAHLLRHLQLTEQALSDPETPINLNLTTDIIQWVLAEDGDDGTLLRMGSGLLEAQRQGPIGLALAPSQNLRELYEGFFGGVLERFWEKNYLWRLHSLTATEARIRGVPNPDMLQMIGERCAKNYATCLLRKGIVSAIPTLLGYAPNEVTKTACVALGDDYCEFSVDLSSSIRASRGLASVRTQ
jgi:hypothetical protein